ncbi:restriction endonuclease [Sphaerotilus montanus]|uniref:Restriction endonuclease type IV Mrr domain-containing protein n=1 Tax=Sphaerotilus montanus TaxID=522889 RepID=A0A7Y9R0V4_9BURK|nr:restriction endonuclease [Sphaerotilus montanus]NYG34246.1 hypothetical protein [Sphaerotilus montanus]NZD58175.1 restriction endonuclease [Sphaerotilus montanus]
MYKEDIYEITPNNWEWFAQDVLFHLGFSIAVGPSEGVDDGSDMIAELDGKRYLVSCKHNYKTRKNVGVREECDIQDRVVQHDCTGFITFYSVGATSGLKRKLIALKDKASIDVIEIYLDNVMDIIPSMQGYILQKYFKRPQEMGRNLLSHTDFEYKPLFCMKCKLDILKKENVPRSLVGFYEDSEKIIHLIYGCKKCVNKYCNDPYWAEIGQIRYIEQMLSWREIVDEVVSRPEVKLSEDFYKYWAFLQEAILQIQVPQGWGRWL